MSNQGDDATTSPRNAKNSRTAPFRSGAAVAERLWNELADDSGTVDLTAIPPTYLDDLRSRMLSGDMPAFVPTDYS